MHPYTTRTFSIPEINGVSQRQIDEHLKLYGGYVTHVNKIYAELEELEKDVEKNSHIMQELRRRLGFEFNGMRLHEYYFGDLESGAKSIDTASALHSALAEQFGSFDNWQNSFKKIAARGSGWMILNYDPTAKAFHNNWVTNHDEGQMATLPAIVTLDFWEHAYMVDYIPSEKGKYLDAYLSAINWETVSKRFDSVH
jgi:superoxide dismutase, Fe-Mn family